MKFKAKYYEQPRLAGSEPLGLKQNSALLAFSKLSSEAFDINPLQLGKSERIENSYQGNPLPLMLRQGCWSCLTLLGTVLSLKKGLFLHSSEMMYLIGSRHAHNIFGQKKGIGLFFCYLISKQKTQPNKITWQSPSHGWDRWK